MHRGDWIGNRNIFQLSEPLGRWLAEQECNLINGGGGGVMETVSQSFAEVPERKGRVIGVIPATSPCNSPEAMSVLEEEVFFSFAYHKSLIVRTHP